MAKESSFDIVSQVDMNEVRNAVNLAQKELRQRYDFKGSVSSVALDDETLVLVSDNEGKLRSVVELLQEKLVRRKVPLKALQYGKIEAALGDTVRQRVAVNRGISDEKARAITKLLRQRFNKLKVSVQGDAVRVFSSSKDELQAIIQTLRDEDFGIPLQFINYR